MLCRTFRAADAVSSGDLSAPTPQGGRQRSAAGNMAVLVVLGSAVTLAMLAYVLAGLPYSAAAYSTALTIDFFMVASAYVVALDTLLCSNPGMPERPAQNE